MERNQIISFVGQQECCVRIGRWDETLAERGASVRTIAIIDRKVWEAHGATFDHFEEQILVEGGEENKSIEGAKTLWERLIEMRADRKTRLLGIGGGTVTDLVAFVASTYMRGVDFFLVPTTLMGQVDAAIGGKCAVNMGGYKNMVGLFSLPREVVCDVRLLASLPEREWRAGLAEVVKTAIIGDVELFELLEQTSLDDIRHNVLLAEGIVARCAAVKCGIVQRDLRESGERMLLNLGHTFAHAIESLSREYSHGEAVAVGVVLAARKAVEKGVLEAATADRIVALVERYGLPVSVDVPIEELLPAMLHDKKRQGGAIHWILPTQIGHCIVKKEEL